MDLKSNDHWGVTIHDKETIKICSWPGSHQMDCEKSEPSTKQERKTNGTSATKLKTSNGILRHINLFYPVEERYLSPDFMKPSAFSSFLGTLVPLNIGTVPIVDIQSYFLDVFPLTSSNRLPNSSSFLCWTSFGLLRRFRPLPLLHDARCYLWWLRSSAQTGSQTPCRLRF